MAFRTVEQLQEKGAKMLQNGATWDLISQSLGIFTRDGRLDPGMAYRIVKEGYCPKRIETRHRLGLAPICPACKHPYRTRKRSHHKITSLIDLPDKELRWRLEHREEMK